MLLEGRHQAAQVRLRWGRPKGQGSRAVTQRAVTCGATGSSPAPRDSSKNRGQKLPKHARQTQSWAPSVRPGNSPSTVFFLKRDAMVRDRARVARLGPRLGKDRRGKGRLLEGSGWRGRRAGEEGGVSRQDPQRAVSAQPTAAESPGAQVTANSHTFWRSHFWATPAREERAPAHCGA